jgi:hypothetical protein
MGVSERKGKENEKRKGKKRKSMLGPQNHHVAMLSLQEVSSP